MALRRRTIMELSPCHVLISEHDDVRWVVKLCPQWEYNGIVSNYKLTWEDGTNPRHPVELACMNFVRLHDNLRYARGLLPNKI